MENYTLLKDQGNALFKEQKFVEAIQTFQLAIDKFHQEQNTKDLDASSQLGKIYVILHINAALAGINHKTRQSYQQAEQFCDVALQVDPKNHKALYRRGLAVKDLGEMLEKEGVAKASELKLLYTKAKKDLEDLTMLDRTNQIAAKKLKEVNKNIYRVSVAEGSEGVLLSGNVETHEIRPASKPVTEYKDNPKNNRKGPNMDKIMKDYKIEEVTQMARGKIENHYLNDELPKSKAELEKALREIQKSKAVYLQFLYRMDSEYLSKVSPTFDMLFPMVEAVVKQGEGQGAKSFLASIRGVKAFELLWKSYSSGQKKQLRQKWAALGLPEGEFK